MENNIYKFINQDDYNDIIFVNTIPKYVHPISDQNDNFIWRHNGNKTDEWLEMEDFNTIEVIDDAKKKIYKREYFDTVKFINIKNEKLELDIEITKDNITESYYARIAGCHEYIKMINKNCVKFNWDDTPYGKETDEGEKLIWKSTNTKKI